MKKALSAPIRSVFIPSGDAARVAREKGRGREEEEQVAGKGGGAGGGFLNKNK